MSLFNSPYFLIMLVGSISPALQSSLVVFDMGIATKPGICLPFLLLCIVVSRILCINIWQGCFVYGYHCKYWVRGGCFFYWSHLIRIEEVWRDGCLQRPWDGKFVGRILIGCVRWFHIWISLSRILDEVHIRKWVCMMRCCLEVWNDLPFINIAYMH